VTVRVQAAEDFALPPALVGGYLHRWEKVAFRAVAPPTPKPEFGDDPHRLVMEYAESWDSELQQSFGLTWWLVRVSAITMWSDIQLAERLDKETREPRPRENDNTRQGRPVMSIIP
jgi:hypothetical protein